MPSSHQAAVAPAPAIHVCVVDDEAILRESLAGMLELQQDLHVIGRCAPVDAVRQILGQKRVDVVLVHLNTEKQRVFSLLKQLEQAAFKGRILIIAGPLCDSDLLGLVSYGVSGILSRSHSPDLMIMAIRKVIAGELWFDQKSFKIILDVAAAALKKSHREQFSDREKHMLRGLLQGLSNKEIAGGLDMEESAVKAAFHRMFKKLGVHSRGQLVRIALAQFGDELQQLP